MPKAAFATLGCKVNQFETEAMEGLFKARGYEIVSFEESADVYVLNTCSVTHLGERKSRQLIRRAHRKNPAAVVAVTGCYAQLAPEEIKTFAGVRVVVGTRERARIVELVEQAARQSGVVSALTDVMRADEFEDIPLYDVSCRTRAFLKIQEGCANFCSYCIIPYTRGPLRSRRIDSVRREAEKLAQAGFKEIVLTGIHLGAYGRDLEGNLSLADAVRETLTAAIGLRRLRLGSLESVELSPQLLDMMQSDARLCPHLHLPLQAGCDEILRAMNRPYTREKFASLIAAIRRQIPDVAISTDVIAGFPGETEEHFLDGLHFLEAMRFSRVHVFPYSRRRGTPAADFPGQVDEAVKKERVRRIQRIALQQMVNFQESFIERTLPVLFETETDGVFDGLTANYVRVYARSDGDICGEIRIVLLQKTYRDGLWGEIVK